MSFPNPSFETPEGTSPINASGWTMFSQTAAEAWAVCYVDGRAQRYEAFTWFAIDLDVAPFEQAVITAHAIAGKPVEDFGELWDGVQPYLTDIVPNSAEAAERDPGVVRRSPVYGLPVRGVQLGSTDATGHAISASMPPRMGLTFSRMTAKARYRHPDPYMAQIDVRDVTHGTFDAILFYGQGASTDPTTVTRTLFSSGPDTSLVVVGLTSTSVLTMVLSDGSGIDEGGGRVGDLLAGAFLFYEDSPTIETFAGWEIDNDPAFYVDSFDEIVDIERIPSLPVETFEGWGEQASDLGAIAYAKALVSPGYEEPLVEQFAARARTRFTVIDLPANILRAVLPTIGSPIVATAEVTLAAVETALPVPLAAGVPYVIANVSADTFKLTTDGTTVVDVTQLGAGVVIADERYFWTETMEGFY